MQTRYAIVLVVAGALVGALAMSFVPSATAAPGEGGYQECATVPVKPVRKALAAPGQPSVGPLVGTKIPAGWSVEGTLTSGDRNWVLICH